MQPEAMCYSVRFLVLSFSIKTAEQIYLLGIALRSARYENILGAVLASIPAAGDEGDTEGMWGK